jgi:ribA/ribD-fused uncharacterized protein
MVEKNRTIYFSFGLKNKIIDKRYDFLSNFYPSKFTENGIEYKTVEHYYQSQKFDDPEIKHLVVSAKTPSKAKSLGNKNRINPLEWEEKKDQVMCNGIRMKFIQNEDLKASLLSTHNKKLVEFSRRDKYWGGSAKESKNKLGELLMQLRDELKN